MTPITTQTNNKRSGKGFLRLTVHVNGPSVPFSDPKKEFTFVERPMKNNPEMMETVQVRSKKRIMNTLSFRNIQESDIPGIISEVKSKYRNLEKTKNLPDGIKWYTSWIN